MVLWCVLVFRVVECRFSIVFGVGLVMVRGFSGRFAAVIVDADSVFDL